PSSDLHTSPVRAPASAAAIAARSPAPPAPITNTSTSWVSYSAMSEEPRIVDGPRGHEPDVQVGQGHHDQARPREEHVALVQPRQPFPDPVAHRSSRALVHGAPEDVPSRVARERVPPEQDR